MTEQLQPHRHAHTQRQRHHVHHTTVVTFVDGSRAADTWSEVMGTVTPRLSPPSSCPGVPDVPVQGAGVDVALAAAAPAATALPSPTWRRRPSPARQGWHWVGGARRSGIPRAQAGQRTGSHAAGLSRAPPVHPVVVHSPPSPVSTSCGVPSRTCTFFSSQPFTAPANQPQHQQQRGI